MRARGQLKELKNDLADLTDRGVYAPLSPKDRGTRVRCIVISWVGHPP